MNPERTTIAQPSYEMVTDPECRTFMEHYERDVVLRGERNNIWPMRVSQFRASHCVGPSTLKVAQIRRLLNRVIDCGIISPTPYPTENFSRGRRPLVLYQDHMRAFGVLVYVAQIQLRALGEIDLEAAVEKARELLGNHPIATDLHIPRSPDEQAHSPLDTIQFKRQNGAVVRGDTRSRLMTLKEYEELEGIELVLTAEQAKYVAGINREELYLLWARIPNNISLIPFKGLLIPEYLAYVIVFINQTDGKHIEDFRPSQIHLITNKKFREAVALCRNYLEHYWDHPSTPVRDLYHLYRLVRIKARDVIRNARTFREDESS